MVSQEEIKIGDVLVPIIKEDGIIYYPISFIMRKVLLKKTDQTGLKKEYSQYIKQFKIDYGLVGGGIQNVYCISEEGLKESLKNSKIGRLSVEQRKAMNILLEYLYMDVISEDDMFIKRIPKEIFNQYDEYVKDCITYALEQDPEIVWQKCTKCGNYYPYHENFFKENPHGGKEYPLYTVCRNCNSKDSIIHPENELKIIYNKYDEEIYKAYKNHNTIEIYNHWRININKKMPNIINNVKDKIKIIKYCYEQGMFDLYNEINSKVVYKVCKFNVYNFMAKVHKELFGDYEEITSIEQVREIIKDKDIVIQDIFSCNYNEIIKKCNLTTYHRKYCNNDLLEFIMKLYDYQYPAYKFKGGYHKYWDSKSNRDMALKYFIEEDMRIPLEKIPIYITLMTLRYKGGTSTLYSLCKKYYKNLFEWIDEIYPGVFNELDFDIHYIRNDFDSIDEAEIHGVLKESFKNVIYNPRNTDRTIIIDGMIPDWFVFTDIRCYIVEYFGMAVGRDTDNKRISEYQEKTKHKIGKYNKIKNYGHIYIFPDDLKDNFCGLREKFKMVV